MASFTEHLAQARHNKYFLKSLNKHTADEYFDWKVTVCFYVSIHLVNAHIAYKIDEHYRKHKEVEIALNPQNRLSPCAIPEEIFLSYKKLHNLSRRSRYLIHEDDKQHGEDKLNHHTSEKHYKKALNRLTEIEEYFTKIYKIPVDKETIIEEGPQK